jgi:curli biogenesis system outer membrane secretion channel CsgG
MKPATQKKLFLTLAIFFVGVILLLPLLSCLTGCVDTATVTPPINRPQAIEPSDNPAGPGGVFGPVYDRGTFTGWHVTAGWVKRYNQMVRNYAGTLLLPVAPAPGEGIRATGADYLVTGAVMDRNNWIISQLLNLTVK